ncbi:MAG TPA: hypothetical protein VFH47_00255, partial [Candidatus Thermoplasmatota archaeon]|nr:hypothetical protein [Candidatus Thermoplasmatota archaeon]
GDGIPDIADPCPRSGVAECQQRDLGGAREPTSASNRPDPPQVSPVAKVTDRVGLPVVLGAVALASLAVLAVVAARRRDDDGE